MVVGHGVYELSENGNKIGLRQEDLLARLGRRKDWRTVIIHMEDETLAAIQGLRANNCGEINKFKPGNHVGKLTRQAVEGHHAVFRGLVGVGINHPAGDPLALAAILAQVVKIDDRGGWPCFTFIASDGLFESVLDTVQGVS